MYESPTVFRADDKGGVYQWRTWTESDSNIHRVHLCTEFGKAGGKLRATRRIIITTGRHDTVVEHADHQARKKHADKLTKEGYTTELPVAASAVASSFASDIAASTPSMILPTLAETVKFSADGASVIGARGEPVIFPQHAQPKVDGIRCVADVRNGGLASRKGVMFKGFADLKACIAAVPTFDEGFGSGRLYLDGELFKPDVPFQKLNGLIRRAQHHSDYTLDGMVFLVFDAIDLDHPDTPFSERTEALRAMLEATTMIKYLETVVVHSTDEVRTLMQRYLDEGHEGLMLRKSDSAYQIRKRTYDLMKLKEFDDAEFEIIGFKEGAGNDAGTAVFCCKTADGAQTFWVRPTGSWAYRARLFQDGDAHIGKQLTVKYQGVSEDGVPRFPVGKALRDGTM